MSYYNRSYKSPNNTFYQTYDPGYNLDQFEPGCGLRQRRRVPSSEHYFRNKRTRLEDMPCCSYLNDRYNMHQRCNCSLRVQPVCPCNCSKMPSLFHKLLSAPYTTKKRNNSCCNKKNKQTQTDPDKQNNKKSVITFPTPPPQVVPQPTHITYHQVPQFIQQVPQPIPINIQPNYQQQVQVPQPVKYISQPNQIFIRNTIPTNNPGMSFKTIPLQNTQHSIKIIAPQANPTPVTYVTQQLPENVVVQKPSPVRTSIIKPSFIIQQKPVEVSNSQRFQNTPRSIEVAKVPDQNVEYKRTQSTMQIPAPNMNQLSPAMFFKNAANFSQVANFQTNQGQTSLSMSKQQRNQQTVSFSSKSQAISNQQNYSKNVQINKRQTKQQQIVRDANQDSISLSQSQDG